MKIEIRILFMNYIAHPFWPETNACIEIEKKSGANRQKSDDKRKAAIEAECERQEVTYEHYLEMKQLSKRQFYQREDGRIYIPRHQMSGALVQTIGGAPKSLRGPFTKDNFRALVQIGDFETELTERSGTFSRFVKLEGSNQRSFQQNDFIGHYLDAGEPFECAGIVNLPVSDEKTEQVVKSLFNVAVRDIGVGAARKMGFGRGEIKDWKLS